MATRTATPTPKACVAPNPLHRALADVPQAVGLELSDLEDRATSAARLALALHRAAAEGSSERLLAWEIFSAASTSAEGLAHLRGHEVPDFEA